MFALIVSVIAISLILILAFATIWYGNDGYFEKKFKGVKNKKGWAYGFKKYK